MRSPERCPRGKTGSLRPAYRLELILALPRHSPRGGLIEAFKPPRDANPWLLGVLAWAWLGGPLFATVAGLGLDASAALWGFFFAAPSMLVSLAASRVARHTAAR